MRRDYALRRDPRAGGFRGRYGDVSGAAFAFFAMAIGAAEVAVGLAIITQLFKVSNTVSTKNLNALGD